MTSFVMQYPWLTPREGERRQSVRHSLARRRKDENDTSPQMFVDGALSKNRWSKLLSDNELEITRGELPLFCFSMSASRNSIGFNRDLNEARTVATVVTEGVFYG